MMGRELIFNLVDKFVGKSDTKRTSTESLEKKMENFGNTKGKLGKRKEKKLRFETEDKAAGKWMARWTGRSENE